MKMLVYNLRHILSILYPFNTNAEGGRESKAVSVGVAVAVA